MRVKYIITSRTVYQNFLLIEEIDNLDSTRD